MVVPQPSLPQRPPPPTLRRGRVGGGNDGLVTPTSVALRRGSLLSGAAAGGGIGCGGDWGDGSPGRPGIAGGGGFPLVGLPSSTRVTTLRSGAGRREPAAALVSSPSAASAAGVPRPIVGGIGGGAVPPALAPTPRRTTVVAPLASARTPSMVTLTPGTGHLRGASCAPRGSVPWETASSSDDDDEGDEDGYDDSDSARDTESDVDGGSYSAGAHRSSSSSRSPSRSSSQSSGSSSGRDSPSGSRPGRDKGGERGAVAGHPHAGLNDMGLSPVSTASASSSGPLGGRRVRHSLAAQLLSLRGDLSPPSIDYEDVDDARGDGGNGSGGAAACHQVGAVAAAVKCERWAALRERVDSLEASVDVLRSILVLEDGEGEMGKPLSSASKLKRWWSNSREESQLVEQVQAMRQTLWSLSKF